MVRSSAAGRGATRKGATSRGRLLAAAACAASLLAMGGCLFGGIPSSNDAYTFGSTSWSPKTVTLVDTRTGETLWAVDVPVGRQLSVKFYSNVNPDLPDRPDRMRWEIQDLGESTVQSLENAMAVPPADARRMEMTLRNTPEFD